MNAMCPHLDKFRPAFRKNFDRFRNNFELPRNISVNFVNFENLKLFPVFLEIDPNPSHASQPYLFPSLLGSQEDRVGRGQGEGRSLLRGEGPAEGEPSSNFSLCRRYRFGRSGATGASATWSRQITAWSAHVGRASRSEPREALGVRAACSACCRFQKPRAPARVGQPPRTRVAKPSPSPPPGGEGRGEEALPSFSESWTAAASPKSSCSRTFRISSFGIRQSLSLRDHTKNTQSHLPITLSNT